jgi:conjugal transfer mating pair stabilization protein TraG
MVMGATDFQGLIRLVVLIGFMAVSITMLLPGQHWRGWGWIISVTVMSSMLFTPKATVSIVDKTGTQAPVVVSHVPYMLAMVTGVRSQMGYTITNLFETGFQTIPSSKRALPAELAYLNSGMMFGNRLMAAARTSTISDPTLRSDISNYIRNCVIPEFNKKIDPATFEKSSDIWADMASTNQALFTSYFAAAGPGGVRVDTCPVVYAALTAKLPNAAANMMASMAMMMYVDQVPADAVAKLDSSLVAAYTKVGVADASSTASSLIMQNAMINLLGETGENIAVAINDPASVLMATGQAQATASMNASFATQGRMAEESMPILRNSVEGILMGVFPIICLLAVMSEGNALKTTVVGYLYASVWIELWPVMFAVINFIGTTYSARNIAGAAYTGVSGLSLMNANPIYSTAISDVSMVGWLVASVPALSGALLFGMHKMMSGQLSKVPVDQVAKDAAEAAKGNVSGGNVALDQQRMAPTRDDAFMTQFSNVRGTAQTDMRRGEARMTYNEGSNPFSIQAAQTTRQDLSRMSSERESAGRTEQLASDRALQTAFDTAMNFVKSSGITKMRGSGIDTKDISSDGTTATDVMNTAKEAAERVGIKDSTQFEKYLKGEIGLNAAVRGVVAGMGVGGAAGASGSAAVKVSETVEASADAAKKSLEQKGRERRFQIAQEVGTSEQFRSARESNRQGSEALSSKLSESIAFRESASANFTKASEYAQQASKVEVFAFTASENKVRGLNEWLRGKGLGLDQFDRETPEVRERIRSATMEYINMGRVAVDDKGAPFWTPDLGEGPQTITRADQLGEPGRLKSIYGAAAPHGGSDTVLQASASTRSRVAAAQAGGGVSPNTTVGPGDLGKVVKDAKGNAAGIIKSAEVNVGEDMYTAADSFDKKATERATGNVAKVAGVIADEVATSRARGATPQFDNARKPPDMGNLVDRIPKDVPTALPDQPGGSLVDRIPK